MRWQTKARVQRIVARLPERLGQPAYYLLQRRFGELRRSNPTVRLAAGAGIAERMARSGSSVVDARVLEIGTGHQLGLPIALWLCGAAEVVTIDLNRYLRSNLVFEDLTFIREHRDEVASLFHRATEPAALAEKLNILGRCDKSLPRLLAMMNIRYLAPVDAAQLELQIGNFDCHVSFTVLEHIEPATLARILVGARKLLRGSGRFVHYIDFSDHFSHSDHSIPSINFLQFTEHDWQRWAGNRFMYQNRLRIDDFRALLTGAGLRVLSCEETVDRRALDELRCGFQVHEAFRSKPLETIATSGAWVVAAADPNGPQN